MYDLADSVRNHLRARTAQVHARLDDLAIFRPILAGQADWPEYVRLLGAYHAFYTAACHILHAGYEELTPYGAGPPVHEALAVLADDMRALGASPARWPGALTAASPAQAVGWIWVIEGSSLGAVVIDRALHALFGARREGRRFFEPSPLRVLRWKTVCASMEGYGKQRDVLVSMTEGAQAAFACMERCLTDA